MKNFIRLLTLVFALGLLNLSYGVNGNAMLQSLLVPGMGQMNGGGYHTYVGLGLMTAEAVALHSVFSAASRASTYAEETKYYEKEYDKVLTYDQKTDINIKWTESATNANKARDEMMLWTAVAAGVWTVNAIEALLLVPKKEMEEEPVPEESEKTSFIPGKTSPYVALENKTVGLMWTGTF